MLEEALKENTAAVRDLIAALSKAGLPVATVAQTSAAPAAVKPVDPPAAATPAPAPQTAANDKVYTAEDAAAITPKLAKAIGREKTIELLAEFKVARAGELKADDIPTFCKRAEALIAA